MADQLRHLLDLAVTAAPGADGAALAAGAHLSRDHMDRLLAAATGETPAALRRRLLLERAAWQLDRGIPAAQAGADAGYGSTAAFSRAFARAHGSPPSRHAGPFLLDAPNGIHFHPPAGLFVPAVATGTSLPESRRPGAVELMLAHHRDHSRRLLRAAADVAPERLERPLRPGHVVVWFEGEESSAAEMLRRLVGTVEVWAAALAGEAAPDDEGPLQRRFERAAPALTRVVRRIAAHDAWDDAFVDALCEPPQAFALGAVVAHVLEYGAIRRAALAGVLAELGAAVDPHAGDAILWDLERRRA